MMNRVIAIIKRIIAARLLLTGVALVLGSSPVAAAPDGSPWGENYFPNIQLLNQDGETVYFYHDLIKDKIVVINFIFTNCEFSCSLETARLREVQSLLGDRVGQDIFMYSITIDPEHDTPSVLKQYAEKFGVAPGWQFLTGKEADIAYLRQKLGLFDPEEVLDAGPRDHSLSLMVGNEATGQWIKRSPHDNPKVLADLINYQMSGGKIRRRDKKSYTNAPPIRNFSRGEYIFNTRCITCHTLGSGDGLGPDLLNVTTQRDYRWLVRWLREPNVMLAEKDPIALMLYNRFKGLAMPNLQLTDVDIEAIIDFMDTRSRLISSSRAAPSLSTSPAAVVEASVTH